jgi:hypothetical protein
MALTPEENAAFYYGNPPAKTDYLSYLNPANYKVFGAPPEMYEGLLGKEGAAGLSRQSNIAGLLGAAAALAAGMGRQGPKRSAVQNILGALSTGYGASGAATQQSLQNYGLQQQILNQQMQREKTLRDLQREQVAIGSIDELIKADPSIDSAMKAYLLNNKDKALQMYMQRQSLQKFMADRQAPAAAAPSAAVVPADQTQYNQDLSAYKDNVNKMLGVGIPVSGGPVNVVAGTAPVSEPTAKLAAGTVEINPVADPNTGKFDASMPPMPVAPVAQPAPKAAPPVNPLEDKIRNAELMAEYFQSQVGIDPDAGVKVKQQQDIAKDLRGQFRTDSLINQISSQSDKVYPTLKKRMDSLISRSKTMTEEKINAEYNNIMQDDARILENMDPKILDFELKRRLAMAPKIDMGSKELEKEFAKGVVEDTRASFGQAKAAVNTIRTIQNLRPIISAGVYEGVLSDAPKAVDQIATALGVSGKTTKDKLQRTAVAMQGLASLELDAAGTMKGQGAITENERSLIARAAGGNLSSFTSIEVQSLLDSLDKVARFKVENHQQNYEVMSKDPIGKKYSKYYKLDVPGGQQQTQPRIRTFNPVTGELE